MDCSQQAQYSVETQHVLPQNCGSPEMSNFEICVVDLGFTAILGDPKFWAIHVGLSHYIALTTYT